MKQDVITLDDFKRMMHELVPFLKEDYRLILDVDDAVYSTEIQLIVRHKFRSERKDIKANLYVMP